MNTRTTHGMVPAFLFLAVATMATPARADDVSFVAGGKPQAVREVGRAWTRGDSFLECSGTGNYLVGAKQLGAEEFTVRARLGIEKLEGTAASLALGQNHFGFDGRGEKLFVEDPDFRGMSVMRMCETDAGTWLLGSHEGTHFFRRPDGMTTCHTLNQGGLTPFRSPRPRRTASCSSTPTAAAVPGETSPCA